MASTQYDSIKLYLPNGITLDYEGEIQEWGRTLHFVTRDGEEMYTNLPYKVEVPKIKQRRK